MKKVRILSIDGGGIRGIIPGTILAELEKILQQLDMKKDRKLGEYFDLIAGTSTGGILSCIYLMPDGNGKAKFSAQEALDLYLKNGHIIFDRTLSKKIWSGGGILHEKYSEEPIQELLATYFGEETIDHFIRPSLITSYEMTDRRAVFFTSVDARCNDVFNFKAKDVARATSAAPTYFSPAHIQSMSGQEFALVDGSVFANNPALCAYAEARKTDFSVELNNTNKVNKPTAQDMIILSVGTGSIKKAYHYKQLKHAGEIKWLEPVIDMLMSGNSETVAYQLTEMYLTLQPEFQGNYYRLEPDLKEALPELDVVTAENINNLYQAGLTFVGNNITQLKNIAQSLLDND